MDLRVIIQQAAQSEPMGKHWRDNFVLAEEDFPSLSTKTPQPSRTATPTKDLSGQITTPSWRPDGKLPGMNAIAHSHKSSSELVR